MTLYLKYRPQKFDDIVWQNFIKNTLSQAIIKDKLVGAYLFCWPRGTGKTSTARIFAKTMNCLDPQNGNACLKCQICTWFLDDNLVDIIEIDAASYTWVDNIREIIEKATFSPTLCRYKIYIIDEVHMLSKWAFNALLKILEEPPSHLKFILATTESHKIPETILSRCQRYDFQNISFHDIKQRLLYIAKQESISIDDESLNFITHQANGGLRNAISLFEQFIFHDTISYDYIVASYGIPKSEVLEEFYSKLFSGSKDLIDEFENISSQYQLSLFFKQLLYLIKDHLISTLSDKVSTTRNIFLLNILQDTYIKSKNSFDPKITFLIGIIECVILWESTQNIPQSLSPKILEPQKETVKKLDVTPEDIQDIFWEKPSQWPQTQWEDFSQNFYDALKALDAPASLITHLKSAQTQISPTHFIILSSGKMSYKSIWKTDNISFIYQALEKNNLGHLQIEVK